MSWALAASGVQPRDRCGIDDPLARTWNSTSAEGWPTRLREGPLGAFGVAVELAPAELGRAVVSAARAITAAGASRMVFVRIRGTLSSEGRPSSKPTGEQLPTGPRP